MSTRAIVCRVCGEQVYENRRGEVLAHTGRPVPSGRRMYSRRYGCNGDVMDIPICPGSRRGARP